MTIHSYSIILRRMKTATRRITRQPNAIVTPIEPVVRSEIDVDWTLRTLVKSAARNQLLYQETDSALGPYPVRKVNPGYMIRPPSGDTLTFQCQTHTCCALQFKFQKPFIPEPRFGSPKGLGYVSAFPFGITHIHVYRRVRPRKGEVSSYGVIESCQAMACLNPKGPYLLWDRTWIRDPGTKVTSLD